MSADVIETREVLAAAYPRTTRPRRFQTHAVLLFGPDDPLRGAMVRVLCNRVRLDNLADRGASDPHAPVTCRACLAAIRRRAKA